MKTIVMKPILACLISAVLFTSSHVFAGPKSVYYDYGRVIKVKPVFEKRHHSPPVETCYQKPRHHYGQHNHYHGHHHKNRKNTVLPAVTGAVVGGVVGNALGKGSRNRGAATAAGAVIGGVVGNELGKNAQSQHSHNQHTHSHHAHSQYHHQSQYCTSTHEQGHHKGNKHHKRLKGYNVTYRYKGEKFTTFMHEHPGSRIKLEVSVRPAVYN